MKEFEGWVYTAQVPLGGRARRPPPSFLVPVLRRLVPVLRTRIAAARRAEATDAFADVVERWVGGKEQAMLDEGRDLLTRDLDRLDGAGLADVVEQAMDLALRGAAEHFRLHGAGVNEIGRLGLALGKRGWSTAEVCELFTGLSDTSTGPAAAQAEIVERARAAGGLDALRRARSLDDVRAIGTAVADAVEDYLAQWATRAVRYEVSEPTVAERPEWLLKVLQETARSTPAAPRVAEQAQQRAAAAARAVRDLGEGAGQRVERAQRAFPLREGNETATIGLPLAALRRAGLAAGRRLVDAGRLERVEDVFDLETAEALAVLRAEPSAPADPSALARQRREARLAAAAREVPEALGPPPAGPPDLTGFPPDIVEGVEAVLWYTEEIVGTPATGQALEGGVQGLGAAPGTYEGTARVILDESGFDRIEPGDVLVCPITSPVWSMVFPSIGALVCDAGGVLSHPAIIAREFAIPAVVGTGGATNAIPDGAAVRVDGTAGTVEVLSGAR